MNEKPERAKPRSAAARPRKTPGRLAAAPDPGALASETASPDDGRPSELTARIRERAYLLYESCGCRCGHELEHWLEAERELTRPTEPGVISKST